jgi:hypothetical protein
MVEANNATIESQITAAEETFLKLDAEFKAIVASGGDYLASYPRVAAAKKTLNELRAKASEGKLAGVKSALLDSIRATVASLDIERLIGQQVVNIVYRADYSSPDKPVFSVSVNATRTPGTKTTPSNGEKAVRKAKRPLKPTFLANATPEEKTEWETLKATETGSKLNAKQTELFERVWDRVHPA